jgi:flagellar biogenesis protein FliO
VARLVTPAVLAASLLASASVASANAVVGATYEIDETEARIVLVGRAPLGVPTWRIDRGRVRVWIPGIDDNTRLDPVVDGWAVRSVRVRPGIEDTAVVHISLRDVRRIPPEALRVELDGDAVTIRIAREALPRVPDPHEQLPGAPDPTPTTEQSASSAPVEEAPETAPTGETGTSEPDADTREALPFRIPPEAELPLQRDTGPSVPLLLLVSGLLAGVYLVVRLLRKKKLATAARDRIEVVSSRRLGPRHQIVVVRALGEDHLLSIHGTQTTRIASSAPPAAPATPDEAETDAVDAEPSGRDGALKPTIFGAQLLRLAGAGGQEVDRDERTITGPRPVLSESVAGLVRLRRAGAR